MMDEDFRESGGVVFAGLKYARVERFWKKRQEIFVVFENVGALTPNAPVRYNGVEVFRAELGSGIAANPYLQFYAVAEASGEFEFSWVDDAGERGAERAPITVVG